MATTLIRTNMNAVRSHNMLEKSTANMTTAMNRVNTTMKINSVQDAPSKWAVSERMRERLNSLNQVDQNVQNDTNMMKTAEKGITNTVEILRTIRSSVLQSFDASTNDKDRASIAKEIRSLFDQIDENAYSTRYNGKVLIADLDKTAGGLDLGAAASSGTSVGLRFQIGVDETSKIDVKMQNMTLKGLGLDKFTADLKTAVDVNGAPSASNDVILLRNIDATGSSGGSGSKFLEAIDAALDEALAAATDVGSWEKRLGYTADNVATQIENLEASDSVIRDADMAKEISEYMKWNVAAQAAQYMLSQSNQNAFQVLSLLQ